MREYYDSLEALNAYRTNGVSKNFTRKVDGKLVFGVKFPEDETTPQFVSEILAVTYAKLQEYNRSGPTRETFMALDKMEEAILWLTAHMAERRSVK